MLASPRSAGKVGRVSATRRGAGGVAPEVVPRAEEALMPGEWRLWTVGPDDGHELELADHRVEGDAFDLLPRCAQRADLRESHGGPRRRRRVRWCRGPGRQVGVQNAGPTGIVVAGGAQPVLQPRWR